MAIKDYDTIINNTVRNEKIERITISPTVAVVEFVDGAKFEYATDREFLRRLTKMGYTLLKRRQN